MLYADHQIRLLDHPVMILSRITMARGLEARSPFMDHEVVSDARRGLGSRSHPKLRRVAPRWKRRWVEHGHR